MKKKMLYKDIPCIKDKAYFIMTGLEGSWLVEATDLHNQDEAWCKNFVDAFEADYGVDPEYFIMGVKRVCKSLTSIQEHIDDSYEEILEYRLKKLITK